MDYRVIFTARANGHLSSIFRFIAGEASQDTATAFVRAIVDYCESFATFPNRGTRRDDIRPGLRTIGFRRRITVVFTIERRTVVIVAVFYGGQNIEAALKRRTKPRFRSSPSRSRIAKVK